MFNSQLTSKNNCYVLFHESSPEFYSPLPMLHHNCKHPFTGVNASNTFIYFTWHARLLPLYSLLHPYILILLQISSLSFSSSHETSNSTLAMTAQPVEHIDYGTDGLIPGALVNVTASILAEKNYSDDLTFEAPHRDHLYVIIPVSIIYAIIFVSGVIGNICTCVVISKNRFMHTATNFYLFSLAISDVLLLVLGLPQEFYEMWSRYPYVFGETFCIIRGMGAETSSNASILTITAFTIERYIAICHPIKSHTMSRPSRAVKIIVAVWLLACICAVPIAMQFGIVYFHTKDGSPILESASCSVKTPFPHSFEIISVIFFFLPMTILTVFYVLIGVQLRKSADLGKAPNHSSNGKATKNGKAVYELKPPQNNHIKNDRRYSSSSKLSSSRKTVLRMLGKFALITKSQN